jgi:3-hydroxyisobutyrate dehydrogenase-like beta-hydroxyacid dehydrogenase
MSIPKTRREAPMTGFSRIALIGFGEVGRMLAGNLVSSHVPEVRVYDIAFADEKSAQSRAAASAQVHVCPSAPEAAEGAELVISAVTAAATRDAARSVVLGLAQGAYFLDLNSASPGTKRAAAATIDHAGGRYVEAAVMTPIAPKGIGSLMLFGGPNARAFLEDASYLGFNARVFADDIGRASAVKMCRSILIKGMETLLMESMLTARKNGVEKEVLASLFDLLPHPDWHRHARYMISRSLIHGKRRAEEVREAVRTVREAGVNAVMTPAIAEREDWAGEQKAQVSAAILDKGDLAELIDALIAVEVG